MRIAAVLRRNEMCTKKDSCCFCSCVKCKEDFLIPLLSQRFRSFQRIATDYRTKRRCLV